MTLTATDLFCGAGGSSLGAAWAGFELVMAANHWSKAVEVHQGNFPAARHDLADIHQVDPRRYPRTDILLAGPECTNHASAKGVSRKAQQPNLFEGPDPGAERSRATMWDVHRFVEHHRYDVVIVENVVEAASWIYWPSWWSAWSDAGYEAQVLNINSAHTGAVHQWRDRIYVIAARKGLLPRLEVRPPSWCAACEKVVAGQQAWRRPGRTAGRWRQSYDYRCPTCRAVVDPPAPPAAAIIDWSLAAERIGDRKRPLKEATRRRIQLGIDRYGPALVAAAGQTWERPGSGYVRAWPLDQPTQAQSCTLQHGIALPFMVSGRGYGQEGDSGPSRVRGVDQPIWAMTTAPGGGQGSLVVPPGMLVQTAHAGDDEVRVHALGEPHRTISASDDRWSLIVPLRRNCTPHTLDEPLSAVCASGGHHALLVANMANNVPRPDTEPVGAITTGNRHGIVYSAQSGGAPHPTDAPTPTCTAKVPPWLVEYTRTGRARPVTEPSGTCTSHDRHALVEPALDVDDCLFRMLEPHEVGRAMAFPDSYTVEGTKKDRVRLYGNAVTPPVMQCIGELVAEAIG